MEESFYSRRENISVETYLAQQEMLTIQEVEISKNASGLEEMTISF